MNHYDLLQLLDDIKAEWEMLPEEDQAALYHRLRDALEPS